jgi:hypothetical protein
VTDYSGGPCPPVTDYSGGPCPPVTDYSGGACPPVMRTPLRGTRRPLRCVRDEGVSFGLAQLEGSTRTRVRALPPR